MRQSARPKSQKIQVVMISSQLARGQPLSHYLRPQTRAVALHNSSRLLIRQIFISHGIPDEFGQGQRRWRWCTWWRRQRRLHIWQQQRWWQAACCTTHRCLERAVIWLERLLCKATHDWLDVSSWQLLWGGVQRHVLHQHCNLLSKLICGWRSHLGQVLEQEWVKEESDKCRLLGKLLRASDMAGSMQSKDWLLHLWLCKNLSWQMCASAQSPQTWHMHM